MNPRAGSSGSAAGSPANATSAFANLVKVGVCCGAYSPALVAAWHKWDAAHGSENDCVADMAHDQLFW